MDGCRDLTRENFGDLDLGASVDFGCVFMHFLALITRIHFGGLNTENRPLNILMGGWIIN